MKKPNLFYHLTLGSILKLFTVFKGQKVIKKEKIKGPAIVLSNHTSFYDFMYTFSQVYPKRVTFIAARKMYHEKGLKGFMKIARVIPKSLMEADMSAVKSTLQILRKGGVVAIFPEGQISPSGATMNFNNAIAKLIKKANVNVYIIKHYGAGLANPPWSKKTFKGKVLTEKYLLLNNEKIHALSIDEIHDLILKNINYQPSEFIDDYDYRYKVNDITNLNNLFYRCPHCGYEGMTVKNNALYCPACENVFAYDDRGFVNNTPYEHFFLNQEKEVIKEINNNDNFSLADNCTLMSIKDDLMQIVGQGKITLTKDIYTYEGTIDGEHIIKNFPVKNVSYLPSDVGRNIQIYESKQVYQFELETPYLPTKFVHAGYYLYLRANNLIEGK